MTAPEVHEALAEVLAAHANWAEGRERGFDKRWYCTCGEPVDDNYSGLNIVSRHRTHLASVLAGHLAEAVTDDRVESVLEGRDWDAAITPAEVFEVGRTAGIIDAIKKHHPDASKGEFLSMVATAHIDCDENPYLGVGDAVGIVAALGALLDDCDQFVDTPSNPNMVKVWAVRQVLEPFGGEPHRWPYPVVDGRCPTCVEDQRDGKSDFTCPDHPARADSLAPEAPSEVQR